MKIRGIHSSDLQNVSAICIDSFMQTVAPTLQAEGIKTFQEIASLENLSARLEADYKMFVCEIGNKVIGFIELKEDRHIAMLFVAPNFQKKGAGKALVAYALQQTKNDKITVNASLTSVPAYLKYGFNCTGDVAESAGLIYQPMAIKVSQ